MITVAQLKERRRANLRNWMEELESQIIATNDCNLNTITVVIPSHLLNASYGIVATLAVAGYGISYIENHLDILWGILMDRKPIESKRTVDCRELDFILRCSNMKETSGGFSGEQYHCEKCGAAVYLDYEDMK